MECVICCEDLFVEDKSDYSTLCGHIFHEKCIRTWMETKPDSTNNNKYCPNCNDPITNETIHEIFVSSSTGKDEMMMAQISSLSDMMKKNEESTNFMKQSLETMNLTLKSFETQNKRLKAENDEFKISALNKGLTPNSKLSSLNNNDMLKIKDATIAALMKENASLRAQRTVHTREMAAVRSQVDQMKNAARGENFRPQRNEEAEQQNMTLKFDTITNKL